jgi:hypothetical protein
MRRLSDDQKGAVLIDSLGGPQQTTVISESGLFLPIGGLLFRDAEFSKGGRITPRTIRGVIGFPISAAFRLLARRDHFACPASMFLAWRAPGRVGLAPVYKSDAAHRDGMPWSRGAFRPSIAIGSAGAGAVFAAEAPRTAAERGPPSVTQSPRKLHAILQPLYLDTGCNINGMRQLILAPERLVERYVVSHDTTGERG